MPASDSEDDPDYVPPRNDGCTIDPSILVILIFPDPDSSEEEHTVERGAKRARLHSPAEPSQLEEKQCVEELYL